MVEIIHINPHKTQLLKTCMECRFRIGPLHKAAEWRCGFSGYLCRAEEEADGDNACGPEKQFWMQRPPEKSGFWEQIGDIIIGWLRGKRDE